jgi:NAD(P)-dependent dehydrogenase (short-subunit alcohol dehydrogenase family)
MDTYAGKVAIVTGGASGIGRAISQQLAGRGATVIVCDVNAGLLAETAEAITACGGAASAAVLDVRDFAAVKKLVEGTADAYGRLDYIFNNAGIGLGSEAHEHPHEGWCRVVDTNLYGVINGVAAAYPLMVEQGSGHIVNTASMAGLLPLTGEISYTTSKHGIVGLSGALRIEAALHGVKVSVVCPGFIRTPIYTSAEYINLDREKVLKLFPKGTSPEKTAAVILADVARNRAVIIPPRYMRSLWWMQRLAPGLVSRVIQVGTKQLLRFAKV